MTGLPISTDWKDKNYDCNLVIIDWLTKMVHYKLEKVTINTPGLAEIILNVIVQYHGLSNSIIINKSSLFTSNLWSLLYSFLDIKQRLWTAFYLQTDGQTKCQNSTIEVYLWAFVNFKQNDWARLLPMTKFAYNNAKNASTSHTSFKLNYGYHLWISYKEKVDFHSKFKSADKLLIELRELMIISC